MGAFCSRDHTKQHTLPTTDSLIEHRQQQDQKDIESSQSSLEEQNKNLNTLLFEMQQKLTAQEIENASLKYQVTVLQQELSEKTLGMDSNDDGPNPTIMVTAFNGLQTHSKSVPDSMRFQKRIHDEDKIQTVQQFNNTLKTVQTVKDVSGFVNRAYKTVDFHLTDDEESFRDYGGGTERESSVESQEKLEIEKAREMEKMKDEEVAMRVEISEMSRALTDGDILMGKGSVDMGFIPEPILKAQTMTGVTEQDELALPSANLFRFESEESWNRGSIQAHKKEMEAAMANLLELHVNTERSPTDNK